MHTHKFIFTYEGHAICEEPLCNYRFTLSEIKEILANIANEPAEQQSVQAAELATLRAQLAEAREALKPFAELLEAMNQHGWKKELDETESAFGIDETWLTIGDFREAAKQVITA